MGQPPLAYGLCLASQGAEVMIGNTVLYLVYAHNQTLPIITVMSLLGLQDHWCFWCFGPAAYQSLPFFTKVLIWARPLAYVPLPVAGLR